MTIHLIEDDGIYAEFIKRSLAQHTDYKISVFQSVEECMPVVQAGDIPDAIITDFRLPGKSGIDFYEEIKDLLNPDTKFIMMSALDDGNQVLSFIRRGVRDYVIKDDTVIDSLKAILEGNEDEYYLFT